MEGAQQWPADGHEQAVIMDAIILIIKGCSITPEVNASVRKEKMDHKGYSPEAIEAFKKAFEENGPRPQHSQFKEGGPFLLLLNFFFQGRKTGSVE